ncbi:hypothetical protein MINS_12470 [Mycolicibacterium insubricum]|uniref:Uncharacterized protein n=1 Tax=Mycolicibacterium insubricum TaxID=444597 RepID=A0A1X0CTG2_9MYCO|nr:hypothetical protein [Mycolicibacterium insubricum]MCV7080275.1 hypothetical protein [Mycolicibacterium insubricum]ORA63192.1 hypothetical protein BST26_20560 [Mycolicibacterium insubricum]BBZ65818.1 hypothetical protein MINS_12470 [Mycolicibacterium insubricum]
MTTVVAPDVEHIATTTIDSALADLGRAWPVATREPCPRPDRYVKLVVTGGRKRNLRIADYLVTARIHTPLAEAVECSRVANHLAGSLEAAPWDEDAVTWAGIESCARFDDPDLPSYAVYQAVVAWTIAIPV